MASQNREQLQKAKEEGASFVAQFVKGNLNEVRSPQLLDGVSCRGCQWSIHDMQILVIFRTTAPQIWKWEGVVLLYVCHPFLR